MRNPTLANVTFVTVLVHLLIAFLLGLQLGLIVFVRAAPQSFTWSLWVPAAVLLLALLFSVLLDPGMRKGAIPLEQPGGLCSKPCSRWAVLSCWPCSWLCLWQSSERMPPWC